MTSPSVDRRLADLVRQCRDTGGQRLFTYETDDGTSGAIDSADVNDYLGEVTGEPFTAKDFRTWGASSTVTASLGDRVRGDEDAATVWLAAVDDAAELLGNTRAVCRASYVHPVLEDAFHDGLLADAWSPVTALPVDGPGRAGAASDPPQLTVDPPVSAQVTGDDLDVVDRAERRRRRPVDHRSVGGEAGAVARAVPGGIGGVPPYVATQVCAPGIMELDGALRVPGGGHVATTHLDHSTLADLEVGETTRR